MSARRNAQGAKARQPDTEATAAARLALLTAAAMIRSRVRMYAIDSGAPRPLDEAAVQLAAVKGPVQCVAVQEHGHVQVRPTRITPEHELFERSRPQFFDVWPDGFATAPVVLVTWVDQPGWEMRASGAAVRRWRRNYWYQDTFDCTVEAPSLFDPADGITWIVTARYGRPGRYWVVSPTRS